MIKLITDKELEEISKYINTKQLDKYYYLDYSLLTKLINSYKYYKEKVSELELEVDDLLDRDMYL